MPKPFEFDESVGFLRQFGALDVSDALRPKVLMPNYVNARTNCLTTTSFYAVFCINECERLLGRLEREIGAPAATPLETAALVGNLPDTVEAPRILSDSLLRWLTELAERTRKVLCLFTAVCFVPGSVFRQVCRFAAQAVVLTAVALHLARLFERFKVYSVPHK